jgi:phosphoribosylaminoimidazole-succinocarboxamide synthase
MNEHNHLIVDYPDFIEENGHKKIKCKNLGEKFAFINSFVFDYLKEYHIPVAFIKTDGNHNLHFHKYQKFPFSVKILNIADKRISKIFSVKETTPLNIPIFEYHYGTGKDSCISENHLISFDICSNDDLRLINRICSKVNAVLRSYFERRNANLVEITCYFGKTDEKIWLVDDFTPKGMKILPFNNENNIDPYKFATSIEIKRYTDFLYNLMST